MLPRSAFGGKGGWFGGASPTFRPYSAKCGGGRGGGPFPAPEKVPRVPPSAFVSQPVVFASYLFGGISRRLATLSHCVKDKFCVAVSYRIIPIGLYKCAENM